MCCVIRVINYVKVTTFIRNFHQDDNKHPFLLNYARYMIQLSGSYNDYNIQIIIVAEL